MCCFALGLYGQSKAELSILKNFEQQAACWNAADLVCYMKAYASIPAIQTISRAGVTKGYDAILAQYRQYFPTDRMGTLTFDKFQFTRISPKYYYVVGRFNLKFRQQTDVHQGYFSVLMKKIKGDWYILSDHSS